MPGRLQTGFRHQAKEQTGCTTQTAASFRSLPRQHANVFEEALDADVEGRRQLPNSQPGRTRLTATVSSFARRRAAGLPRSTSFSKGGINHRSYESSRT
jgi:hypothetical protein